MGSFNSPFCCFLLVILNVIPDRNKQRAHSERRRTSTTASCRSAAQRDPLWGSERWCKAQARCVRGPGLCWISELRTVLALGRPRR
ncbi:unnamed protein product [Merluccius merluccius]